MFVSLTTLQQWSTKSLILFAVASHHTTLHQELYANAPDPFFLDVENEKYFEQIIEYFCKKIGIKKPNMKNIFTRNCQECLTKSRFDFGTPTIVDGKILREQFVIIEGILNKRMKTFISTYNPYRNIIQYVPNTIDFATNLEFLINFL